MAEGRQELEWDLSNNIMCQVLNSSTTLSQTMVVVAGGKRRQIKPVEFTKLNPYRDD